MTETIEIGVIGGSGFYNMPDLTDTEEITLSTPFGDPSGTIKTGMLGGQRVAFIARHGAGHPLNPSEVPYAANTYALKSLGVKYIVAVSAAGSLREDYAPGHICIPDQLVDRTFENRRRSFFTDGLVAHVGVADPFSTEIAAILAEAGEAVNATVHHGGTFVTVEGPRFSTKAESETYRQHGYSIIGMTTSPEAFLAREAEIAYAVFAHVTDYDVWHEEEGVVTAISVLETLTSNLETAQKALVEAIKRIGQLTEPLPAHSALENALVTRRKHIPAETYEKLRLLVGKYYER